MAPNIVVPLPPPPPHSSIASRKQIFRRRRRGPTAVVNSCKRNEKEIIRPRMGTWRGTVHSYILAMTNIANSGDARMTVSAAVCAKASFLSKCVVNQKPN